MDDQMHFYPFAKLQCLGDVLNWHDGLALLLVRITKQH